MGFRKYVFIFLTGVLVLTACCDGNKLQNMAENPGQLPETSVSEMDMAEEPSLSDDILEDDKAIAQDDVNKNGISDFDVNFHKMKYVFNCMDYFLREEGKSYVAGKDDVSGLVTDLVSYGAYGGVDLGKGLPEFHESSSGAFGYYSFPEDIIFEYGSVFDSSFDKDNVGEKEEQLQFIEYDAEDHIFKFEVEHMIEHGLDVPEIYGYIDNGDDSYTVYGGVTNEGVVQSYCRMIAVRNPYADKIEDPVFMYSIRSGESISEEEYLKGIARVETDKEADRAKEIYRDFLDGYEYKYIEAPGKAPCYHIGYVDEDRIPELFVSEEAMSGIPVRIYTLKEDTVCFVGEVGNYGGCRYVPYKNVLVEDGMAFGQEWIGFFGISREAEDLKLQEYGWVGSHPEDPLNYDENKLIYTVDRSENEVSHEEYLNLYRKYMKGNLSSWIKVEYGY